jgi:hypothetical protein
MALQQYQCFRFKNCVYNVPIHYINGEPVVFLEDIRDKFGFEIRSFTCNDHPLAIVRNDRYERETPLRIRAIINETIDCDEPKGIIIGQTTLGVKLSQWNKNVENLREDIKNIGVDVKKVGEDVKKNGEDINKIGDDIKKVGDNVIKIDENVEELNRKADAILKQTFQLNEFTVPRLFIILPDETKKFNPANLIQCSYRLFFLCECENEKERHLAFHDGYELSQPREFIKKYGPYLKAMLTVVKYAVTVGSIAGPLLSELSSKISVPDFLKDEWFSYNFNLNINQVDNQLSELTKDDRTNLFGGGILEGPDLRQLESFLKEKDVHRTLGNLYRSTTKDGSVRWVCLYHYDNVYNGTKRKQFHHQFRALGGTLQGDEATIDQYSMKNFDEILKMIDQGFYVLKLTVRECKIRESIFDRLLTLASERPNIKCLEFYSICVSSRIGFKLTHREIIDKLDKTVNKEHAGLTIKYIVEYPKTKSSLDLDLFDYALGKSTEALLLHVYTRDDGKKIVLTDLNEPDLCRMVKSLEHSKTITCCSMDKFNRDLSHSLLNNPTITQLTIFLVKFDEQKIADLRYLLCNKQNLRALRCSACENLSPLITMLSQELGNNVKLEILALNGISDVKQLTELFTMLKKNDYLTKLNLALNTNIDILTFINISNALTANRSLKILKLTGIQGGIVQQDSSIDIFEIFFRNTCMEQVTLHFHNQQAKISQFRKTIQAAKIQSLNLINCNILTEKKFNGISPIIISNSLYSLSICSCGFSFEDAVDLFQGLIQNKTLAILSLSNILIPYSTSDVSLATELKKILEQNTGLKKLTYSHGSLEDKATMLIGEGLKKNTILQELNISFNRVGNAGAAALADALKINNTLLSLIIKGNQIENEGIKRVLQTLQSNVTLQQLNIFHQSSLKDVSTLFTKEKEELLNVNEFIHIC